MTRLPLRRRLAGVILLAALGWACWGLGNEWRIARFHAGWGAQPADRPSGWRLTSRAAGELRDFALRAAALIPPGTRVGVEADLPAGELLFLRLWLAYVMPRHDLVEATGARAQGVDYVIAVSQRPDRIGRRMLLRDPFGVLLRNLPPGRQPGPPGKVPAPAPSALPASPMPGASSVAAAPAALPAPGSSPP